MKKQKENFYIEDWAGNIMFNYETFETYEDAFDFILTKFPNDEDLQDIYIKKTNNVFFCSRDLSEYLQQPYL